MRKPAAELLGEKALRVLARLGCCEIRPGLSDGELAGVEDEFGFEFSDDHRAFLAAGLPVTGSTPYQGRIPPWPDWRDGDRAQLRDRLQWPVEGVLFDVEVNDYWYDGWGDRPPTPPQALAIARERLPGAPQMVPVHGHRYLPAGHGTFGHVVLSMYQTDIICYGADLVDYIHREFDPAWRKRPWDESQPTPTVPFWRDLVH